MVRDIHNDNIMLFKRHVCVHHLTFCFIILCDRYGFKKSYVKQYFYKLGEWKSVLDIFCLFILSCEMYLATVIVVFDPPNIRVELWDRMTSLNHLHIHNY